MASFLLGSCGTPPQTIVQSYQLKKFNRHDTKPAPSLAFCAKHMATPIASQGESPAHAGYLYESISRCKLKNREAETCSGECEASTREVCALGVNVPASFRSANPALRVIVLPVVR